MVKTINSFRANKAKLETVHKFKNGHKVSMYSITCFHTLVQYIGYGKYINRNIGNVYLRGQQDNYDVLIPTTFRSCVSNGGFSNRCSYIKKFITKCTDSMPIIKDLDDYSREPLLQHYGIKTRWIDIVDNLWISLWFGVHDWNIRVIDREYKSIIPRNDLDSFMYLFLICSDATNEQLDKPGLYKGDSLYTIDLRKSCPSTFLRPHAQHALLIRKKDLTTINDSDLSEYVIGIAKIKVADAFNWIGSSGLSSSKNVFPPVNYDHGYGILIEQTPHDKTKIKDYGSIFTVSY